MLIENNNKLDEYVVLPAIKKILVWNDIIYMLDNLARDLQHKAKNIEDAEIQHQYIVEIYECINLIQTLNNNITFYRNEVNNCLTGKNFDINILEDKNGI